MSQQDAIDINAVLNRAISPEQRSRLDAYTEPLRTRLYDRIRESLLASVRMQVECCSSVGIHSVALERLILEETEQWGQEQQYQEHLHELVQAGAPFAMLHSLHGLNRRDFDALRKGVGLHGGNGSECRKSVSDTESASIYRHWETLGKPEDARGLLELHRLTQLPLCLLWGLVQDWGHVQTRLSRLRQGRGW